MDKLGSIGRVAVASLLITELASAVDTGRNLRGLSGEPPPLREEYSDYGVNFGIDLEKEKLVGSDLDQDQEPADYGVNFGIDLEKEDLVGGDLDQDQEPADYGVNFGIDLEKEELVGGDLDQEQEPADYGVNFGIDLKKEELVGGDLDQEQEPADYGVNFGIDLKAMIAEAANAEKEDLCEEEGAMTLRDYCMGIQEDSHELFTYCKALMDTTLIFDYSLKGSKNTIFAPVKDAWVALYRNNLVVDAIDNSELKDMLKYHTIPGKLLDTSGIWCRKKYKHVENDRGLKVICKSDIAGDPVVFVKGSDKKSQKKYTPYVLNAKEPIKLCNANIFMVDNFILQKKKKEEEPEV